VSETPFGLALNEFYLERCDDSLEWFCIGTS